jgi:hypothetical protein
LPEFCDFKVLHAEGFDDAVSGDRLLKDLGEIAEAGLTIFGRAAILRPN